MERTLGEIELHYTDKTINDILRATSNSSGDYSRRFTTTEDFFLSISSPIEVPSFPIHHDVRVVTPSDEYSSALRSVVEQLTRQIPQVLSGLRHFFDPGEVLRPAFFQVYRVGDQQYLYLVHLNIQYDPARHETVERGSNDRTAVYRTNRIVLDADIVPLRSVRSTDGRINAFVIDQSISQTWIGETGRGYLVQGIWIDRELTKFLSKLVLPAGKRSYPYYPVTCKYRSVCYALTQLGSEPRKQWVVRHHQIRKAIAPYISQIQACLKHEDFSESLDLYQELKAEIPEAWEKWYRDLHVQAYLNDKEMREFLLED